MGPSKVATSKVIAVIEPNRQHCFLANRRKQVYTLDIVQMEPQKLRLGLSRPAGRRNPIDTSAEWELSFRDGEGAYHGNVVSLVPVDDRLIWAQLPEEMDFLVRRRSIRLATGGRNPTSVSFDHGKDHLNGFLVDISLEGLGIQIPGHKPSACPLTIEDAVTNARFELRSFPINIASAKVAHISQTDDDWRVGLQFVKPAEDEMTALRDLIHSWHMTQRASGPSA
ncbi:MAG: PilZ domain-containing protein [Acidobacteriota bacterium]|nr:PilZ domain-containing protein [Acidobacteriota bacterium]